MADHAAISNEPTTTALRRRIVAVFAMHGVVLATMNMRMPDLQLIAGLNDAHLGLVLMGAPVGALAIFPFAPRLIETLGTRRLILLSYLLMPLAAAGVGTLTHPLTMFALLAAVGSSSSLGNIAINVEADRVEALTGARLMNRCHGSWSIVFFAASMLAGLIRGAGIDPTLHLWGLVPAYWLATLVVVAPMAECPPRPVSGAPTRRIAWPTPAILSLFAFGLGAFLLEGASRVWATIYMRDVFHVSALMESLAVPALVLTMAAGRLLSDRWIEYFGPVRYARWSLALGLLGLGLVVAASGPWLAIGGFAVAGLGVGVAYPLMISGAARLGDRPASQNVASIALVFQLVTLLAPMLTGAAAEAFGVRAAFALQLGGKGRRADVRCRRAECIPPGAAV
ncbi:MAG: hypothetical protein U1E52_21855 [Geminicoccaceae bacterium]